MVSLLVITEPYKAQVIIFACSLHLSLNLLSHYYTRVLLSKRPLTKCILVATLVTQLNFLDLESSSPVLQTS